LSAGLELKGYAGAQLSLMLYGVIGPYAEINAYLKLEADIADDPWWTLYGGLEVPVGVKIEVLGHSIADYEGPAIGYRLTLAQAQSDNPPNLPFSPYPADGAVVQNLNADLSWSGGDLDGDAVTYDVYFEAGDDTPDVLVSNDQTGIAYDPGTLSPSTHYYWRIVAKDEHGATTAGPVWDYTTATGATCPIALTLQSPQANNLGVTISGTVASACSTITRLNWQWGDGVGNDQWFPASHTYAISGTYRITATAYNNLGQTKVQTTTADVSVPIVSPFVVMDAVYTTDYWDTPKTTFGPGEAIKLALRATNHTSQTIPVTYTWITYDPSGVRVSYLSFDNWTASMPPGEDVWRLTRGITTSASLGTYVYTASVSYASQVSKGSTTFTVQGTPIPPTFTTADAKVYVWTAWEGISGAHTAQWEWYRPDGTLAYSSLYNFTAGGTLLYVWYGRSISTMSDSLGQWSVKIYMDGSYKGTRYFTLVSGAQSYASDQPQPFAPAGGAGGTWPPMQPSVSVPIKAENNVGLLRQPNKPR
jgi:hypothetical protein